MSTLGLLPGRSRVAAGVVTAVLLTALTGSTGGLTTARPYDLGCPAWTERHRSIDATRAQDRERAFLCLVRDAGGPMFPPGEPDQALLGRGRALCAQPGWRRADEWLRSGDFTINLHGLDSALVFLCPDAVGGAALRPSDELLAADEADYVAASNAACRDPWPRTRARAQGTAAYFTSEGGGYHLADDRDPANEDGVEHDYDGLLAAGETGVAVRTIGGRGLCVTVKAFGEAPPLRLKGWQEVAEVGVTSRSGRLAVPVLRPGGEEGAGRALPNLAIDGPGHYRVRVYARADADSAGMLPAEWHLIVVHPGRSRKEVVHR
ncbi:hypothetical protein FXF51_21120 [Nonomuraea sp. PA05]|uniref:hypothetical protein n=1 Tax=Nonomuraea sp. PA05 TaxID=2604466 RepID=UPI0011DC2206|nr:hypothetical protein [Nonomuraea sp. PA05]TYB64242.1 hypothetical protein FXF51_21120 [Nonomuraea sp. PA05]